MLSHEDSGPHRKCSSYTSPGILLKQSLISWVWPEAEGSVFLTSSHVPMLLDFQPHLIKFIPMYFHSSHWNVIECIINISIFSSDLNWIWCLVIEKVMILSSMNITLKSPLPFLTSTFLFDKLQRYVFPISFPVCVSYLLQHSSRLT